MATRLCFVFPPVSAATALDVLWRSAMAGALPALAEGEFRLRPLVDGEVSFVARDPRQMAAEPGRPFDAALAEFEAAFASSGRQFSRAQARRSLQFDDLAAPGPALFWLLLEAARGMPSDDPDDGPAQSLDGDAVVVLEEHDAEGLAERVAAIVTLAAGSRIGVGDETPRRVVLHVRDDAERGAMLSGLAASGRFPDVAPLTGYPTTGGPVFLPEDVRPYESHLRRVGDILRAAPGLLNLPDRLRDAAVGYAVGPSDDGDVPQVVCFELPARSGEQVAEPAARGLRLRLHMLADSDEAARRLREDIARAEPPSGYRLKLHRLPEGRVDRDDVQRLRERIDELTERIALIEGLRAPQYRLMRFDATQLPALADGLRRFPVSAIDGGEIEYGFQADAKAPLGIHYLLFRPGTTVMSHPFPEWHWRGTGRDSPITYWVDPYWARFYQLFETRSLVFVPHDHVLLPTLHSFAEADMDAYLHDIMCLWFPEDDASRKIPDNPIYLFTPSTAPEFDIAIEVLDRVGFRPIRERLGWLNDNLEVADAIDIAAFVKEGAYEDYRRRAADALRARADEAERAAFAEAEAMEEDVLASLDAVLHRLGGEIEATVARARNAAAFVDELTDRMVALERVLASTYSTAEDTEAAADRALDALPEFERFREGFDERLTQCLEQADRLLEATRPQIDDAMARLHGLRNRLDLLRHG